MPFSKGIWGAWLHFEHLAGFPGFRTCFNHPKFIWYLSQESICWGLQFNEGGVPNFIITKDIIYVRTFSWRIYLVEGSKLTKPIFKIHYCKNDQTDFITS